MVVLRFALLTVLAAGLSACSAASSPAARNPIARPVALEGPWLVTMTQNSGVVMDIRMALESPAADRWVAHAGEGRVRWFLSAPKALAARLTGKLPPRSALMHVADGRATVRGDSVLVRGTMETVMFGQFHVAGAMANGRLKAELRRDSVGAVVGTLEGVPRNSVGPVRDYKAVAARIRSEVAKQIYDPHMLDDDDWRGFFAELDKRMGSARDDLEAMAAFYSVRPRIAMTHFDLVRNPIVAATPQDTIIAAASAADPRSLVTLTTPAPGVAILRIRSFNAVAPAVDEAFVRIDSIKPHTLIIDIRANGGGDVSSLTPAAHLLRDSAVVGVFLSRKWYDSNRRPPTRAELASMRVLSDAHAATLIYGVREHGAIVGVVPPMEPRYTGNVFLLLDRNTGSASEPLAHFLKVNKLATLVGEKSAGGMLSALPFAINEGFVVVIPEADYFAADGQRLEGVGVTPHINVPSAEAMLTVAQRIHATHPFDGAMLLGSTYLALMRWTESQRWYEDAVRRQPETAAALYGLGRALLEQKQWDAAFDHFERALARNPSDPSTMYLIGRTAAQSGLRLERGEEMLRRYLQMPVATGQPSHASARWRLGMIHEARGDVAAALREYQEAARIEPANAAISASLRALQQRSAPR